MSRISKIVSSVRWMAAQIIKIQCYPADSLVPYYIIDNIYECGVKAKLDLYIVAIPPQRDRN